VKTLETEQLPEGSFQGAFGDPLKIPTDKPSVVFLGRSNSGKSSLLRSFFRNSSLVRTSSKPGSTITLNAYLYRSLYFIDTPGFGYAKRSRWERDVLSEMISLYLEQASTIKAGILTLDCLREPEEEESYIAELFRSHRSPLILALTKTDRLNQKELSAVRKRAAVYEEFYHAVIPLSSVKRSGLEYLLRFFGSLY